MSGRPSSDQGMRHALDGVVAQSLRPVSAGLAVTYAVYGAVHLFLHTHRFHVEEGVEAWVTAAILGVLLAVIRRRPVPPRLAHPVAAGLAGLVLANSVPDMAFGGSADETVLFIFLMIGVGALFLSWRWLGVVLSAAAASWLCVALIRGASEPSEWVEFGTFMGIAMALSVAIHAVHLRSVIGPERVRRYHSGLIEGGMDLVVVLDAEGAITFVSPSVERVLGWKPQDVVGSSGLDLVHPDDLPRVAAALADSVSGGGTIAPVEGRIRHRDGSWRHVEAVANNLLDDPAVAGIVVNARDVTDRRRAEAALREAEDKYRSIFENAIEGIFITSVDGRYVAANPAMAVMLGYSCPEELISAVADVGELYAGHVDRDDFIREIERHGEVSGFEYQVFRKDGSTIWVSENVRAIRDAGGDLVGFEGMSVDITERKRAEEQLEESHRRLAEAQGIAQIGSWDWDMVTGRVSWSDEMCRLNFVDSAEFRGTIEEATANIHPDDRELVEEAMRRRLAGQENEYLEYRILGPDGAVRVVRAEGASRFDRDGRPVRVVGTVQDITEHKRAEEVLRASEAELQRSLDILRRTDRERRDLLEHLIGAQETERERIAEGIEDEHIQHLAAVGIRLETLRRRLSDPEQLGAVDVLGESVQEEVARLRGLLLELRPRTLDQDGLAAALHQYVEQCCPEGELECSVLNNMSVEPPADIRAAAYRIVQEAVANVRAHANAAHLDVLLEDRERGFLVRVTDDGVGFDPIAVGADPSPEHLGLSP